MEVQGNLNLLTRITKETSNQSYKRVISNIINVNKREKKLIRENKENKKGLINIKHIKEHHEIRYQFD